MTAATKRKAATAAKKALEERQDLVTWELFPGLADEVVDIVIDATLPITNPQPKKR